MKRTKQNSNFLVASSVCKTSRTKKLVSSSRCLDTSKVSLKYNRFCFLAGETREFLGKIPGQPQFPSHTNNDYHYNNHFNYNNDRYFYCNTYRLPTMSHFNNNINISI